jgi:hypothetical protein
LYAEVSNPVKEPPREGGWMKGVQDERGGSDQMPLEAASA